MKKIILLTLSLLLLFQTSVIAITELQAKKYVDREVMMIVTHTTSVTLYGTVLDIVKIGDDICLILDGSEYGSEPMILSIKNITYIRSKKGYE